MGLAIGLILGQYLLKAGLGTLQDVVEKVSYSLRWPTPPTTPIQVPEVETAHTFDALDTDDERIPAWRGED